MHTLLLVAVLAANPQPSPTPLRTIVNIRSREMCTVLREKLAPAVGGVLANDQLARDGQAVMNRLGSDAQNEYADDLGGAGAASSMDNLRMENVVAHLVSNIEKIEKLLDNAAYRGKDDTDAGAVAAVRRRLQTVLTEQKAELNVLAYVTYSNQGRDVQAKKDPTGGAFHTPPPSAQADITPAALPEQLQVLREHVGGGEDAVSKALRPIIDACH